MSIGPNSPGRGCAANFPQPVDQRAMREAETLEQRVLNVNRRISNSPLATIVYRESDRDYDINHPVYRWGRVSHEEIFQNGFQATPQEDTPDEDYFNLENYVHHARRPLGAVTTRHAFVSTTRSGRWNPPVNPPEVAVWHPPLNYPEVAVYRYEIYAPGGIDVALTLGNRYQYPAQQEISFVRGIAPQYIRSAQGFGLTRYRTSQYTRRRSVNTVVILNANFNPQWHPPMQLTIQRPICDYEDDNGRRVPLTIQLWPVRHQREKRQVSTDSAPTDWYAYNVANSDSYIDAAFRSSRTNEAYLFMKNEYLLLNYAPGTTNDKVLNGPLFIGDGFPSLRDTAFADYGIDCAFRSSWKDEAFIFSGNLCAVIIYAPGTLDDKIKKGPMTITAMFPFLKGTVFERGVDAAFEATADAEAYLFKGNRYALINYGPNCHLIGERLITEGFHSLRRTIFEGGIDAAFASHRTDEAYIFKGDSYALINFAPGSTNDYIIGGVKKIRPNWPSLHSILPRNNRGLDFHDRSTEVGGSSGHEHDEL